MLGIYPSVHVTLEAVGLFLNIPGWPGSSQIWDPFWIKGGRRMAAPPPVPFAEAGVVTYQFVFEQDCRTILNLAESTRCSCCLRVFCVAPRRPASNTVPFQGAAHPREDRYCRGLKDAGFECGTAELQLVVLSFSLRASYFNFIHF